MKALSIRANLAVWYFLVFAGMLALVSVFAFHAMRNSMERTVDEGLRDRASGVEALIARTLPQGRERLDDELRENFELRQGAEFSQVADEQGHWLYRSPRLAQYAVAAPRRPGTHIEMRVLGRLPVRMLATEMHAGRRSFRLQVSVPMDDFEEALDSFRWLLLLASPLVLILASLGGYWMSRRALAPVDAIAQAARNINPRNLATRLAVPPAQDELRRLSETLNGMLDRIQSAFERVTQFTADASHELRSPVALMRTAAEVALRQPRTDADYRGTLEQILKELERTSLLLEQLMTLARADSGFESLEHTRLDIAVPLRSACHDASARVRERRIDFHECFPAAPVWVMGDGSALHRLFAILIDNAIKYSPAGGGVTASLISRDGSATVEIQDAGPGIAAADLPHIFERFWRAEKARARDAGGAGLGLAIGQWIAQAHGGSIDVESVPGKGSRFRVCIPATHASASAHGRSASFKED